MIATIKVEFEVEVEVNEHDDFELVSILDDYTIEDVVREQVDTQMTYEDLMAQLEKQDEY